MASVDDRDLALGRLYGKAILGLAVERGQADNLLEELAELASALERRPELGRFLGSPLVSEEDRSSALETMFRGRASDLLVDALEIINRKGRLGYLPAIAEGYRLEYRELNGLVDARVRTAVPLTEDLRRKIQDAVARFTGKRPFLIEKVDPSLIGGVVIEVGGQKIDGSVASRLHELSEALELRGSQEIVRSRA
jgi:F-type H+-transporting ATPase subunit delta